jgi:hypothetical protein
MNTLNEIEAAVSQLSVDELARFRQWFAEFDAQRWDQQLECDASAGKLDALADAALNQYRSGRCTPL